MLPETGFEDGIEALCLSLVPLDRVLDLFRCVAEEVVCLALSTVSHNPTPVVSKEVQSDLHWTNPALHPGEPFHYFPILIAVE